MRHRDDVAAAFLGLEDVEHLAHAGPEQLGLRLALEQRAAGAHERHRIAAGVGNAAGEDGDDGRHGGIERGRDLAHLGQREDGGDVELHLLRRQFADQREGGLAARIGDGDLDVDVLAPAGELERLALHLREFVGKDLEGDGLGGDGLEDVLGEGLVILDAGLLHQGGVGGEALDVGLGVEVEDAGLVGAVGVDLDLEGC